MVMSPKVGVIARVGAHKELKKAGAVSIQREEKNTPFGKSNPVHLMELDGDVFALISRHGEMGYEIAAPWVNARANLWALKDLGVEKIVSFSSPGSLDPEIGAGDLILPDDVLDERRSGPFSFFEGRGIGVIRQCQPFCPGLAKTYLDALREKGFSSLYGGVYVGTHGPRLETPAEIRKLRLLGGTLVGMTLVPEVFLAREIELCYGALCLVVNQAEGIKEADYAEGILFEGLAQEKEMKRVRALEARTGLILASLVHAAARYKRDCMCGEALKRYKLRGDLDRDWRKWWQ